MPMPETISNRNLRRRTRYAEMSPQRKQLFLSQLREKRAQSKRQKNLHQSNSTAALTICTSNLSPEQASQNTNVPSNSPTGEHIVSFLSTSEGKAKNLQLYFYDNENELTNRMTLSDNLNELIITKLMDILKLNPYSTFLRSLTVVPNLSKFYIALNSSSTLDQRTYNLPTVHPKLPQFGLKIN
ncbi:hypothetical protein H5410_035280 [Solanum commersonii]|uniref:Uncharacterized protein n=1 Tax=Solanum commersonii TaxID=4109 RepID=A0A9J5Y3B9_SOLCO|nr:hypothetical protein H5410_035280 [Solanum commersonii]